MKMPVPSENTPAAGSRTPWGQLAILFLPVIAFYGLVVRYFVAVPIIDDYWYLIVFGLDWHKAASAGAKLDMIMHTQVGPYKLILIHALLGLQLALSGRLHFPMMIWAGNLALLGVFALLWKSTPRAATDKYPWLVLLPVSLLLFSLNYAETVDWAVMDLQEPGVILLTLAAVYFLVKPGGDGAGYRRGDFALACGLALLAAADYANGLLVFPVGILFLLLQSRRLGGSSNGWPWGRLAAWSACFAAMLYVFLTRNAGSGISARVPIGRQLIFLLSFCGGGLENMHRRPVPYLSVIVGAGVIATVLLAIKTRYYRRNPFFFYSMLWLLSTAMVVANARVALGLQLALSGRYKIFSDLLLICCYQYGLDRFRQRQVSGREPSLSRVYLRASVVAALLFCIGSDIAGRKFLATRKDRAETAMRKYLAAPQSASPMFLAEDVLSPDEVKAEDESRQELNEAIQAGIYTPPPADHLGF